MESVCGVDSVSGRSRGANNWIAKLLAAGVLVLLALAGTFALYREAIGLPFFFDDMIHLRWLEWHSLPSIWATAEGLGYYRPLTMSVWKVSCLLLGGNDPQLYHGLNLLLHALNTILVAWITWRTYRGPGRYAFPLLAAALFMTFPFSYQAVPSSSSLSKPLIASLVLASVALYWEARRRRSGWLLSLSLLLAVLAPFAYESGVTLPLAILAVEALGRLRREFGRLSWWPALYLVLVWGVGLPLVMLMEPETGASLRLPDLANLWQNAVYLGQGLVFPIAPLATPLADWLPLNEYLLVALVNALGLVALWASYRWRGHLDLFWYGLSWFGVGVLPLWLMLDFRYVITSPRILYLGGVGSALIWAGLPVLLWFRRPFRTWARVLAAIIVVGMLVFNVAYVRHRMVLAEAVATPLWQAAEAAREQGAGASLLYLNVPAWVAPKTPVYRIGTEGLTFIPEYVRVQDWAAINAGVEPRIKAFMYDPVKQDWRAYIGYAGEGLDAEGVARRIRKLDAVYRTDYTPDGLRFIEAGALEGNGSPLPGQAPLGRFGDGLLLTDVEARLRGAELELRLGWYAGQVPQGNVTVFVHVYDGSGQLVAQRDGVPLAGLFPPKYWLAGDQIRDVRYLFLPEALPAGKYTVAVGWYDADTGERLSALDGQGQPVVQDAIRVFEFERP